MRRKALYTFLEEYAFRKFHIKFLKETDFSSTINIVTQFLSGSGMEDNLRKEYCIHVETVQSDRPA